MKNFNFKKLIPHLIAVGIFLLVTVIFCKPALESGVVMKQADISGSQGMSHQSEIYREKTGHFPLWVTSMFSGMPAYNIAIEGHWSPLGVIDHAFQLWLPKPLNFFFLACICFYFLCMCLRTRPWVAIIGSLAFAYCSFSPIIITAGHDTEMLALAYAPALMGAAILLFNKKYWPGFTLAVLFTALQIQQNHLQISFYLLLVLLIMSLSYLIYTIRQGQAAAVIKSLGLLLVAGIIGVAVNAIILFPTYDYAKASKRGGQLIMNVAEQKNEKVAGGKTTGLSKDYAFQWSYSRAELLSMMFPGVKGYGLHYAVREGEPYMFPQLKEDSKVVSYMAEQFPQAPSDQIAQQMSQSVYWGDQPFTNGPVYFGAVICFLFILSMFYIDKRYKWWILAASVLGALLALGHNLDGFNTLMFNYFPLYNKFRVPTMALVIPQILFPLAAVLVLDKLWNNNDPKLWTRFKYGVIATGVVFIIAFGYYSSTDFGNENKQRTAAFNEMISSPGGDMQAKYNALNEKYEPQKDNQVYENWILNLKQSPDAQKTAREILTSLKQDRAALFLKDIMLSLLFVLIAAAAIAFYIKQKIKAGVMTIVVTLIAMIDLFSFDVKYLNEKSFDSKDTYEATEFPQTETDRMIMADKDPNFRVYNASVGSPFEESKTSYYHKSIGGYSAAKMGIYDDLSKYQMGRNPNIAVLNMLNTKWIITGEGDAVKAQRNYAALGNAWFIKGINFVKGPVAEMQGLDNLNTKDSAVVDEEFKNIATGYVAADSTATIAMTSFDNDAISYESNSSSANAAVFSEIYYKDWKAYIDGKPAPYFKANYVLRAMVIPAGKHKIEFKYEPKIFFMSKEISLIFSWLVIVLLLALGFVTYMKKKQNSAS